MSEEKKIIGQERREWLLNHLMQHPRAVTGSELARLATVSRQVIVQDISLLKAKGEPIMATSQGYMYIHQNQTSVQFERIIACDHSPDRVREELYLVVDHGVTMKNVIIEHPVYGDLTASIMVSTRVEVDQFLKKIESTGAAYLSELTDGTHLHTLVASSEEKLDSVCASLKTAGFLL